jgi:hypothetical protein
LKSELKKPKPIILKWQDGCKNHIKPKMKKNCEIDNFVGIMVGGLSYWFNPYDELSLLELAFIN